MQQCLDDPGRIYVAQPRLHGFGFLCNAKVLEAGITGVLLEEFNVRETSATTYLRVWPANEPAVEVECVLKGLMSDRAVKLVKRGAVLTVDIK
ncbi:MAG: hypothetical protein O3C11_07180 [Proteobacteria bacterium]|nr:hypothetical protein [Pseudomonadota bacterium]